jgi:hypothetical protein
MSADLLSTDEAYPHPMTVNPTVVAVATFERNGGIEWMEPETVALVREHFRQMWKDVIDGKVVDKKVDA